MLIKVDCSQLEWRIGSWLANDQVALEEILTGFDAHSDNQIRFNLPERLIAKVFLFRLIFGGTAYTYANDADFLFVSSSTKFWEKAIEAFKEKYVGWVSFWERLILEATTTGKIISPFGREWEYHTYINKYTGEPEWPITRIKNYIVQGTSADIMSIVRTNINKRWDFPQTEANIINTVHDDVVFDTKEKHIDKIIRIVYRAFRDVNEEVTKRFGVVLTVPLEYDILIGMNMKDLEAPHKEIIKL
jgi:DNA polymerase-1